MARLSKKAKLITAKVDKSKRYSISESVSLLKEFANPKFDEAIDVSVVLGVDPRKSDQNVRGASVLPNGTGKTVRVAVFTQGPNADAAKEAGADVIGMEARLNFLSACNTEFFKKYREFSSELSFIKPNF